MKRIFIILGIVVLLFSGCTKDNHIEANNEDNKIAQEDTNAFTTDNMKTEGTITTSPKNDFPGKEDVTVRKHNISKILNGYPYWYTNKNAEKILNTINKKDRKALKEMISKSSQAESDIEKQIDILFKYLDGNFIDYEEDLPGEDEYSSYGEKSKQSYSITVLAKTDKSAYFVDINFVLKDEDKKDNVGIEYIIVTKKEIMDYYFDNYDSQSQPKYPDKGGIWCMGKDGVML